MKRKIVQRNLELYFAKKTFYRFFVPAIFSMVCLAMGGLADCFFVGNHVGAAGLTAVGLGAPVYLFFSLVSIGAATGGSIHYANALSRGDAEEGNGIFNCLLRFVLIFNTVAAVIGLLFLPQILHILSAAPNDAITAEYVRVQLLCAPIMFCQAPLYYFVHNDNAPRLAAVGMVVANAVDVLLNYIFVGLLGVGAVGSVYSTAIGAMCNIVICLIYVLRRRGSLRLLLHPKAKKVVRRSIRTGFASASNNLYQFILILVINRLLMDHAGVLGVAVFNVVHNISLLIAALVDSVGLTIQPMTSTYFGERNFDSIRQTLHISLVRAFALCSTVALVLTLTSPWYCPLFGLSDPESLRQGVIAIALYCLSVPFAVCTGTMVYFYQAVARERRAYLLYLLRAIILSVPTVLLLSPPPLERFWWFYFIAEAGTFLVLLGIVLHKNSIQELESDFKGQVYTAMICNSEEMTLAAEHISDFLCECGSAPAFAISASLVLEELCGVILEQSKMKNIYIQTTLVCEQEKFTLHIRDNALRFNPFELSRDTGNLLVAQEDALMAVGMKIVNEKTSGFFYRRYAGFNTLVIKL